MLPKLKCEVCSPDIEKFYDLSLQIVKHHQHMLTMASNTPHGAKILSGGRVVVLRDGVRSSPNSRRLLLIASLSIFLQIWEYC